MIKKLFETDRLMVGYGDRDDYAKVHEYDFNYLMNIDNTFKYVKRDPYEVRRWYSEDRISEIKSEEEKQVYDFILYTKDGEAIGNFSFDRYNEDLNSLEIACYLHPNYWKNGYMQEALISSMKYIYDLGYDNIIYSYIEGNENSRKLCEKIGFELFEIKTENNFLGKTSHSYRNIMSHEKYDKLYNNKVK